MALADGDMTVKGNRLLQKSGSNFVDVPDYTILRSQEAGLKLRARHAEILENIKNEIYNIANDCEAPDQEIRASEEVAKTVSNDQQTISFVKYAGDIFKTMTNFKHQKW